MLFSLSISKCAKCVCVYVKSRRQSANTVNMKRWSLTYNRNFTTASSTMTLFISRPTRVHTGIILFLHWAYHQRPIWLNFLTYIVGQFTTACANIHHHHHANECASRSRFVSKEKKFRRENEKKDTSKEWNESREEIS